MSKNFIVSLERSPSKLELQNSAHSMLFVSCPLNSPTFSSPLSYPSNQILTFESAVASIDPCVFHARAVGHFLWVK